MKLEHHFVKNYIERNRKKRIGKQEGNFSLLLYGGFMGGLFKPYFTKYYSWEFSDLLAFFKDKYGILFFSDDDYERVTRDGFRHFLQSGRRMKEIRDFEMLRVVADRHYNLFITPGIKEISTSNLEKNVCKYLEIFFSIVGATLFTEALHKEMVYEFYRVMRGEKDEFERFFEFSSKQVFGSFDYRASMALLRYGVAERNRYICADYYIAPEYSFCRTRLKYRLSEEGGIKKLKKHLRVFQKELVKNRKEVGAYKRSLSPKVRSLFDFMHLCSEIRDIRKESMQKLFVMISDLAREVFVRNGLDQNDIPYASYQDFFERAYLNPAYRTEIKRRKAGVAVYFEPSRISFEYSSLEKKKRLAVRSLLGDTSDKELKGFTAHPGFQKGIVRIIRSSKDFKKFRKGGILVTSMTRPEFAPLMKRAVAIVTDEGGVTSHAAIVARELKKPCVIGTKFATQVLKDGDLVEVDANKGIVTILNRF